MNVSIELFLVTIVALLPIANPLSTAALFLAITNGDYQTYCQRQALVG